MKVLSSLGAALTLLGALSFVWHVAPAGVGSGPSLICFAVGAATMLLHLLLTSRRARPSSTVARMWRPTV